jgi:hypothetical protein
MKKENFAVISYIDDFLVVADSMVDCQHGLDCLTNMIVNLGLAVNWDKVSGPERILSFLGISINCIERTLALPEKKLAEVKQLIDSWSNKKRCAKHDLQRLIGKLNWCARVVVGGRTFIRGLINLMIKLKEQYHHTRLNAQAKADLAWWRTGLSLFHGVMPFTCDIALPSYQFSTDACEKGGGAIFNGDWCYVAWNIDFPELQGCHINILELKMVQVAMEKWGHLWRGLHIRVRTDNMASVYAINKGCSRSENLQSIVRQLFWLSVKYQFRLSASHLAGFLNIASDRVSRMNVAESAIEAKSLLSDDSSDLECVGHMSNSSFCYLQEQWMMGY